MSDCSKQGSILYAGPYQNNQYTFWYGLACSPNPLPPPTTTTFGYALRNTALDACSTPRSWFLVEMKRWTALRTMLFTFFYWPSIRVWTKCIVFPDWNGCSIAVWTCRHRDVICPFFIAGTLCPTKILFYFCSCLFVCVWLPCVRNFRN